MSRSTTARHCRKRHRLEDRSLATDRGASVSGSVLSYSVTDGGANDADGTVNGVIVDPVGVGVLSDARAVPVLPVSGLMLLAGLLALFGARQRKAS